MTGRTIPQLIPMKVKNLLIITCFCLLIPPLTASDYQSDGGGGKAVEWQILTKDNFSSHIHLNPHVFLFVTIPWCGESRSLMKELSEEIARRDGELGVVKLAVVYRNSEWTLANLLDAKEGISIMYYRHSVAYKHRGGLRTSALLSFVYSVMSLPANELLLKPLETPEDVSAFLDSTDKGVILFEFCGWTPALLNKWKDNFTEDAHEEFVGPNYNGEPIKIVTSTGKEEHKDKYSGKLKCPVENKAYGISLLEKFRTYKYCDPIVTEDESSDVGSCGFKEFQQFDSFLTKFITLAREFFLPPERQKFGLISERSLLSSLDINESSSWLVLHHFAGCPDCSTTLKEGDDLKRFLQMQNPLLIELEDDNDLAPTLPANMPSLLLFVDRSSVSSTIREKSKDALDAFRELALHYQTLDQRNLDRKVELEELSAQTFQASGTSKLGQLSLSRLTKENDKLSIMVLNEGKLVSVENLASGERGNSLRDILADILQQKKEIKLSSLAQGLGFQLLSSDMDVKVEDMIQSATEQSNKLSPEMLMQKFAGSYEDLDRYTSRDESSSSSKTGRISKSIDSKLSSQEGERTTYVASDGTILSVEYGQFLGNHEFSTARDLMAGDKRLSLSEKIEEELPYVQKFRGSFFVSDGGYRLLGALTAGSNIPSLIIVDPNLQQHYIFPEDSVFNISSLADFVSGFSNGSLIPYQQSESVFAKPMEAAKPPFVNLDFHEMNSIPRITARHFSKLMFGAKPSDLHDTTNSQKKDMLILFSNSWCGFCQRMELVVREVHRALKGYISLLKNDMTYESLELPLIYLMDCTLNECSTFIKLTGQREVHPALILFPAKRERVVSYNGSNTVSDIVHFIAEHGSNCHHLIGDNGVLHSILEEPGSPNVHKDPLSITIRKEAPVTKDKYYEVLLKKLPTIMPKFNLLQPHTLSEEDKDEYKDGTFSELDGSILVATEKLLNVHPFEGSTILLVKVERNTGFLGLIVNKRINWDSIQELENERELLNEAPLSFGGPVMRRGMPLVSLTKKVITDEYPEVLPGVYFLDQMDTIREIEAIKSGNHSVADFWFFFGYSTWGWEQLFHEIGEGAWTVTNYSEQIKWP